MAFDLGAALKNVSKLDTGKEQIIYLPIGSLDSDPKNFYELRGIEELADNISVAGLQQPIRVRAGEVPGRYTIVSGHRRLAAVKTLAGEDPEKWADVPCIIETDDASPALQQLRLIYANANTRVLSSAETSDQAQQVEQLLYQLQEEGYEFPGRMRDHVAEAVGVSRSKLARLKVIREHLIPDFEKCWRAGKLSEDAAYTLAKARPEQQQIIYDYKNKHKPGDSVWISSNEAGNVLTQMTIVQAICDGQECFRGCTCDHGPVRQAKAASLGPYGCNVCRECCRTCPSLRYCSQSCEYAADVKNAKIAKQQQLAAQNKAKDQAAKEKKKAAENLERQLLVKCYGRIAERQEALGLTRKEVLATWNDYVLDGDYLRYDALVHGKAQLTDRLPGDIWAHEAQKLVATADKLGCSVDYLLGRDVPGPGVAGNGWKNGTPEGCAVGDYVAAWAYSESDGENLMIDEARWVGDKWIMFGAPITDDMRIWWWIKKPEGAGENGS